MQFDPHHLSALTAVLRRGSFEAAATDLSVTPSAISQRIKALEDRVGITLINRGAPCTGTPAGLRLAKHAEDVGVLEAQLGRDLSLDGDDAPVRLRVAVNADSLATWFVDAMSGVPDVLFDLVIDDQDHSAEWLKQGAVSAAVTAHGKTVTGCDATALGSLRYIATASPDFVKQWFPDGDFAGGLSLAPCLTFSEKDALQRKWITENTGAQVTPPTHYLPSTHAFVDAARAGVGWGMNPEALVRGHLRNGRLTALLPDAPLDIPLTWQVSRIMAQALEPVTAAVIRAAGKGLISVQNPTG